MKKCLSFVLAVLLFISVAPVSYASPCEHIFNAESVNRENCTFICSACKEEVSYELADYSKFDVLLTYDPELNLYTTDEYAEMAYSDFQLISDDIIYNIPENLSIYEQYKVDEFVKISENKLRDFSADIKNGKYGIVIDAALLLLVMAKYDYFIATHEPLDEYFNPETLHKIKVIQRNEFYHLTVIYNELSMDVNSITQESEAEFVRRLTIADDMVCSMINCADNQHSYNDDNVCDFCGKENIKAYCDTCGREHIYEIDEYFCFIITLVDIILAFVSRFI